MTGFIRKRKTKKGNSWQIILDKGYDSAGKRLRDSITIKGLKSEASQILNDKLNEFNKGMYIEPSQITVEQHLKDWMDVYSIPSLAETTVRGYWVNIRNHIIPYIGSVPLQKLVPAHIQRMVENHQKKGLGPRSIKYVLATLHKALDYAYKMQMIPRNVSEFVAKPKCPKYKGSAYEEKEVIDLLQAVKGNEIEIIVQIGVGLGLRRGEMLALRWEDIDFDKKRVTVSRNLVYVEGEFLFRQPKSESGKRTIEIPSGLIEVLKRHKRTQLERKVFFGSMYEDNGLVCSRPNGRPYNPGTVSHMFDKLLKKLELRHIRLHDLRHTNASLMLMYNVPPKVASQRLGHSSIGITLDLYSHVIGNMQTEAASKIDDGIYKTDKPIAT